MSDSGFGFFEESDKEKKKTKNLFQNDYDLDGNDDRYLIFSLGDDQYATPLLGVREITEFTKVKHFPNTKDYFLGVTNLRGQIVGVIDLRLKFGLEAFQSNRRVLMVFDTENGLLAALVDKINIVSTIKPELIDKNVKVDIKAPQEFLIGIARFQNDLVSIINLEKIVQSDQFSQYIGSRSAA